MESLSFNDDVTTLTSSISDGREFPEMTAKDHTFMEQVENYTAYKIAIFIDIYWLRVLVPIGFVGNTLSFLVMVKPNNRKVSTCIYMAAIGINDNIMMCLLCYHTMLLAILKVHEWHGMECKVIDFLGLYALQNSTFQVLAMTIDKYIAIKWPHRAATYSTSRRAKMITVTLSICAIIYNTPHLLFSQVVGGQCIAYATGGLITKVYSWFTFVLNAVIPFTLLIHMNYVIVKTVQQSRNMFKAEDTTTGATINQGMKTRQKAMKSAESQLTIMLLLVTTLFLILLCPTYIRFIYLTFTKMDTPFRYATTMLFFQISFKLYATNSGINFFLYCISGQKFRNDLQEIMCCCSRSNRSVSGEKCESQTSGSSSLSCKSKTNSHKL